jgi:hypothetical protein
MKITTLKSDKKTGIFNDKYIWILLVISLLPRIYMSFFTYIISNDSVHFIRNAKYFADGDFLRGLAHDYHPLYSLFMAALYKVVPNIELSGTIISVFFGTLTVIAFYLIGKGIFDRKISFVSAIILAMHPYAVRFSADIISESTYFFFFISAFGLGFFAITNRKPFLFALTGISSALAYLARPEGIGVLIIVVSWCILKDFVKIKAVWRGKLISISILVVSFCVFSIPYIVYIKKETGHWSLSKKKDISKLAGVKKVQHGSSNDRLVGKRSTGQNSKRLIEKSGDKEKNSGRDTVKQTTERKSKLKKSLSCILHIVDKYLNTFHLLLFMFLIIGVVVWARIRKERAFGFYIVTVFALYFFVLYRLSITHMIDDSDFVYPSKRHLMPLVMPTLYCAGIGVYATGAWMHEKFQRNHFIVGFKEKLKDTWVFQLIVLMVVVSVLIPKTLKPLRFDKLGIKEVGYWIKEHSDKPDPVILSSSVRVAYYAGAKHIKIKRNNDVLDSVKKRNVDYIAITDEEYMAIAKELLQYIQDKKIKLAYKYPEEGPLGRNSRLLYKVLNP